MASAYVHLNPVRVSALGLVKPDAGQVRERLRVLREHRWSSYRVYGNYAASPECLVTRELLGRAGGRERYRRYVQSYVTRGMDPAEFTGFSERVALGSREFLDRARSWVRAVSLEQPDRSFLIRRVPFEKIVKTVEAVKGEAFADYRNRHGDWGLAMVLYLSRRRGGQTLAQIGELAGGMAYKTVFAQVKRFEAKLMADAPLRAMCLKKMSNVETPKKTKEGLRHQNKTCRPRITMSTPIAPMKKMLMRIVSNMNMSYRSTCLPVNKLRTNAMPMIIR